MPRTLTGTFSASGFVYSAEKNTTEYQSNRYVGWMDTTQYGVFLSPGEDEVFTLSDFSTVTALTFRLKLKKKTTNQTDAEVGLKWYSSAQSWYNAESLKSVITGTGAGYELRETVNTTEEQVIERSFTGTALTYVLRYGLGVYGFSDQFQITEASVEATVSDRYVKPVISLKDGYGKVANGTYYHYPQNPMTLIINYSQEVNDPLVQVVASITPKNGSAGRYSGEIGLDSVDIPDYEWHDLPEYGTISLYAISEAGVVSDTITYPFVVAQYDIYYLTHTSGTIIQSDEDVKIGWGAQKPGSYPSSVTMTAPTKYWVYQWWDDDEPRSAESTTSLSYTVSASALASHKILHIAVCEVYGDNQSERELDYAPVLNLYIQQVAGTSGVDVGLKIGPDGECAPAPYVTWESTGQTAYQVRFGDYDSGPVWGSDKKHIVQYIFPDGTYPVQVRVQDANGAWSDWTEPVYVTVWNTLAYTACTMRAEEYGEFVRISAEAYDDLTDTLYWCVYRNGMMIAQLPFSQSMEYIDRTANGECTYFVRMMLFSGAYTDSDSVTVNATGKHDVLLPEGSAEAIPLLYTPTFPKAYNYNTNEEVHLQYFAGRNYPVAFRSGKKTRTLSMEYVDFTGTLAPLLESLTGSVVLFKDTLGGKIKGVLNSVPVKQGRKYTTAGFVITQVDWDEEVPYIWEGV